MEKWFDKHFSMNRKELQGLSFLTVLVIFLWFLPTVFSMFVPAESFDFTLREKEIQAFLEKAITEDKDIHKAQAQDGLRINQNKTEFEYFPFDPNVLDASEGKRLGLSDYQIRMIQNYVSKGGKFYKKEDFAKIYAVTDEDFQRLSPYINIPEPTLKKQAFENRPTPGYKNDLTPLKSVSKDISIELNRTDSIELQQLQGIGPVFASRIIRFRDLLGGFHDKAQLLKVYGMDEARYNQIQDYVNVDTTMVQKININRADYQQLTKHPYISSKQANVIVQYRKQHGNYSKPADLLKIATLNEEFLRKIVPYLTFIDD